MFVCLYFMTSFSFIEKLARDWILCKQKLTSNTSANPVGTNQNYLNLMSDNSNNSLPSPTPLDPKGYESTSDLTESRYTNAIGSDQNRLSYLSNNNLNNPHPSLSSRNPTGFEWMDPAESHQTQKQDLFQNNNNPSDCSIELKRNEVDLTNRPPLYSNANIRQKDMSVSSADFYL